MFEKQRMILTPFFKHQTCKMVGGQIRPTQIMEFFPLLRRLSSNFRKERLFFGTDHELKGKRQICTTSLLMKRQSPLTVKTPRWKTAAIERKQLVTQLRKPKSIDTLKAGMQLSKNPVNLSLFTTTRIRPVPEEIETVTRLKPEVFLSKDETAFICYHPAPLYPKRQTKESYERPKWHGDSVEFEDYSDAMTDEQENEAKSLIQADSNLWSATVLGHMLKVKPGVVSDKFPRTKEQQLKYHLERNMLQEWGKVKRMEFRKYQHQERIEYIKKTRGEEAVLHFKRKMNI